MGKKEVDDFIFEMGGKNKTRKQIKGIKYVYLVKDDILIARNGELPLHYFGFLY